MTQPPNESTSLKIEPHKIDAQVERLCNKRCMRGPRRGALLRHLVKRERAGTFDTKPKPTGQKIMFDFYVSEGKSLKGRPIDFTAEEGRKLAGSLRATLKTYYTNDADAEDRIEVRLSDEEDGAYRPIFSRRADTSKKSFVDLFWGPYIGTDQPTLLVYGVPMFMQVRNEQGEQDVFIRRVRENTLDDARKRRPQEEISRAFVPWGDMLAVLDTTTWLTKKKILVKTGYAYYETSLSDIIPISANDNAIFIGNKRTNGLIKDFQQLPLRAENETSRRKLPFRLRSRGTEVVHLNDNDETEGPPFLESKGTQISVPVVVTRREGARAGTITMIASNHARALHRVTEILFDEGELSELFRDPRLKSWDKKLPTQFQIVLSVAVLGHETVAGRHTVEAVWDNESNDPAERSPAKQVK